VQSLHNTTQHYWKTLATFDSGTERAVCMLYNYQWRITHFLGGDLPNGL